MTAPSLEAVLEAAELASAHPPRFVHPHKRAILDRVAGPDAPPPTGQLVISRWRSGPLPEELPDTAPLLGTHPGFFRYDPATERAGEQHWHVNFADRNLFGFYGGALLAQDEMQVLEHPLLGSVREWFLAKGHPASTADAHGPTPVLVEGVERRLHFRTQPAPGRSLYGNAFARASTQEVLAAVEPILPPTRSHIIAMAAPNGGSGTYRREEVEGIVRTAYTAFRAAVLRSGAGDVARAAVVHTGWWGCGAFGGNRELMALLQFIAARLAGVAQLRFHYGDADVLVLGAAVAAWHELAQRHRRVDELIDAVTARRYRWGTSDGN